MNYNIFFNNFILVCLLLIQSCIQDDEVQLFSPIGDCSNNIRKNSPYQKLVFFEDFIPNYADPCYSDLSKLTCRVRPDWGMSTRNCPTTVKREKFLPLNKCTWSVYTGWNFWEKNWNNKQAENLSAFDDSAVDIKDGNLVLKVLRNPDYDPKKDNCGLVNATLNDHENYYGTHCPISVGGIDSKYFDSKTPGFNMQFGRIEFKAFTKKFGNFDPLFSAVWMWPNDRGTGHPHKATSSIYESSTEGLGFKNFGEIDILEHNATENAGYSSYVNWFPGKKDGDSASIATRHSYSMDTPQIYGLEWDKDKIRWYINDCKIAEIKKGDISKSGIIQPLTINDIASYIIIYSNLGKGFSAKDNKLNINSELLIDYISVYE